MKVLLVNSVIDKTTSTGKLVNDIADGVSAYGGEPIIAYSQPYNEKNVHGYYFGVRFENKLHAVLSRLTGLQGYFSPLGTIRLIRKAKREKIALIHLHNMHSNDLCLPLLFRFLRHSRIPVVLTLHDCWLYTARCFHYTKAQCDQWTTCCAHCNRRTCRTNDYWLSPRTRRLFADKKRWYSDIDELHAVGVSEWITLEAHRSMLKDRADIHTILNWIDTQLFHPCDNGELRRKHKIADHEKILLGVCSNWSADKGIESVIALSKRLPSRTRLVLVGNVPVQYRSLMDENVIYLGRIADKSQLARVYSAADVYLNLSLEESFGMTNAEALACGTPILVYDSTASTEFVSTGCGYAAKVGDFEDLVHGAKLLLESSGKEFSQKCRSFAETHFSRDRNVMDYIKLYDSILKGNEGKTK